MKPKIIISHDVDHLFPREHYTRDAIYPKLWVKSVLKMANRSISPKVCSSRIASTFEERRHRIPEVMEFDKSNGIRSTFFFGMNQGLGMSYKPEECEEIVRTVIDNGFDVGVHGICYDDPDGIIEERRRFESMFGMSDFGIRMHYVRYAEKTFERLAKAGYLFDTTQFGKEAIDFTEPYKIEKMWEFPLYVMDGYIVFDGKLQEGIEATKEALNEAEKRQLPYFTILFHDYLFNERCFPDQANWYKQVVSYLEQQGYCFASYKEAVRELERS